MAEYYDRIAKTLLVSENYLWHAAAINKLFKITSKNPKASTELKNKYINIFDFCFLMYI